MAANNHQPPQPGGLPLGGRETPRQEQAQLNTGAGDLGWASLPAPQPLSRPGQPFTNTSKGSR